MIFIDSNIVIDLIEDGGWTHWSKQILGTRADTPFVANLVVVAEVSRAFGTVDDLLVFLDQLDIALVPITPEAAFRAGRAHVEYRLSGGRQGAVLADFLIAGHAVALGATLVTRDRRRFASYFPELTLITPETDNG